MSKLTNAGLDTRHSRCIQSTKLHTSRAAASRTKFAAGHAARYAADACKVQSLQLRCLWAALRQPEEADRRTAACHTELTNADALADAAHTAHARALQRGSRGAALGEAVFAL